MTSLFHLHLIHTLLGSRTRNAVRKREAGLSKATKVTTSRTVWASADLVFRCVLGVRRASLRSAPGRAGFDKSHAGYLRVG